LLLDDRRLPVSQRQIVSERKRFRPDDFRVALFVVVHDEFVAVGDVALDAGAGHGSGRGHRARQECGRQERSRAGEAGGFRLPGEEVLTVLTRKS
jgi:hypothetical protein